jgi:hypothetical protein
MFGLFESLLGIGTESESKNNKLELVGNYQFYVEPSIIGFQGIHTSTVILTVYADESKRKQLDFTVKWSKILNNQPFDLDNYEEQHYHLTPSDIDLKIRAAISCNDPKHPGVAYLYIGPIDIDQSLMPEIEGSVLNLKASFKARILHRNKKDLPPNDSLIRIDKPYLIVNYDPRLEDMNLSKSEVAAYMPLEINFEQNHKIKVRVDNLSTTNVAVTYRDEQDVEQRLVIQFESRERRDSFYIFLRLLRSIKTGFLDKLMSQYDVLLSAPWSPIEKELGEEDDDPEGEFSFYEVIRHDSIREHLRTLLRIKHELSMDNLALTDSLTIMEEDLNHSAKQFRALLDEGRSKKPRNLARYEKSISALGELSFSILDDLKKSKKGSPQPTLNKDITEEIKQVKEANIALRKEIDAVRQGKATDPQASPLIENSILVSKVNVRPQI